MKKPNLPRVKVTPDRIELVGFALAVVGLALLGLWLSGPLLAATFGCLAAAAALVFIGEGGS